MICDNLRPLCDEHVTSSSYHLQRVPSPHLFQEWHRKWAPTMSTIPESTTIPQTISQALTETAAACPLHIAIREMARLAVTQHVLYLEGECLPRPDIARELEIWFSLHALVSARLCVAARTIALDREEFTAAVETIRARAERSALADRFQRDLEETLIQCSACAWSSSCPLGNPGDDRKSPPTSLPCPVP